MSKDIRGFFSKVKKNFSMATKLTAAWSAGSRIVPSQTQQNDKEYQLRLDTGELLSDRYRVIYLQVNSQAKSTKLKEWVRKHGTHGNLASAQFDTLADDPEAETDRVLEELEAAAKNEI
jgi:hypothetical protein